MVYLISCAACDFEDELAELEEVLATQESHEEAFGGDHVVEFELLDDDE